MACPAALLVRGALPATAKTCKVLAAALAAGGGEGGGLDTFDAGGGDDGGVLEAISALRSCPSHETPSG